MGKCWKNASSYPLQAQTSTSGLKYLGYTKLGEGYGPRQGLVDEEKALLYVLNENKPFISVFKILDNGSLKMQSEVKSYKKASHFYQPRSGRSSDGVGSCCSCSCSDFYFFGLAKSFQLFH